MSKRFPLVEVQRAEGNGSVFLSNPGRADPAPVSVQRDILSITAYWL